MGTFSHLTYCPMSASLVFFFRFLLWICKFVQKGKWKRASGAWNAFFSESERVQKDQRCISQMTWISSRPIKGGCPAHVSLDTQSLRNSENRSVYEEKDECDAEGEERGGDTQTAKHLSGSIQSGSEYITTSATTTTLTTKCGEIGGNSGENIFFGENCSK